MHRHRLFLALALVAASLLGTFAAPASAESRQPNLWQIGRDAYTPGEPYRGDFPDPTVLRVGDTFYAYATSVWRMNLPVVHSTDLSTWEVSPLADGQVSPDALPAVPVWAAGRTTADGRTVATTWAPSVARAAGRYVAAYTVHVAGTAAKMCISVAVAASPEGPFVDSSTAPLVCPRNRGAIDPQVYREGSRYWLLYKTEDISIGRPTRLWARRLTAEATAFRPGSTPHLLLQARDNWERRTIEGPAMIRAHRRHFLVYSAGGWANPRYAIGYARCRSVIGPCARVPVRHHHRRAWPPLLSSGNGIVAPGGGTPFRGPGGTLRMAYHAWDAGAVGYEDAVVCLTSPDGCSQRRMHVATLRVAHGRLRVTSLGLG